MILENIRFKKIANNKDDILRIFLALVFLSAGIFRIFNAEMAALEYARLSLPIYLSPLMIIFEIGAGLLLLINRYTKFVYYLLAVFMLGVFIWSFILDGRELLRNAGELFVFNLNPTDLFLHFVFLLIIFVLIIRNK